jgi:hypothetical protein
MGKLGLGGLVLSLWLYGAPPQLTGLAAIMFAQVFLFEFISRSWKISMHTAVLAACLAGCIEIAHWSPWWLTSLIPLCWARYHRGRHLWSQAVSGGVLGYVVTTYPLRWWLASV